ncbi:MAG: prolyl oligopeptidase family serine peptidase [Calditrichaeota bacterium]|nr:prolyl oligopeptidase family serine peptidase [Calditrichota bacterium]MCB0267671.1 prolyl oligopeptidase family serine peptidase [Calditrichota bacterium]MCB0288229.1 prolyl oligopeptidase family serine peptidase [Calditrichota bacterium]MCB0299283.1 prolyl oligopeptidase family serine peptidase [Calditrichota bacterium]
MALIFAGIALLICQPAPQQPVEVADSAIGQTAQQTGDGNYLLYLPENFSEETRWPLIVYLHGASLRGENPKKVGEYGLPRMLKKRGDFPFVVLSPQCPSGESWHEQNWLMPLIDDISEKYGIDTQRIYLTGVSLGGSGTWFWGAQFPEKFAAIAPLCGYGNPETANALKHTPIWTFHGAKDRTVPVELTDKMVAALEAANGNVLFSRLRNKGHNIVEDVYQNEDLYEWFLEHRR